MRRRATTAAQPREDSWASTLATPRNGPPSHRSRGRAAQPATTHNTGPSAEGGGGWPMHATAQPWHAEGRPLSHREVRSTNPTGALWRRAQSRWTWRRASSSTLRWPHWTAIVLGRPTSRSLSLPHPLRAVKRDGQAIPLSCESRICLGRPASPSPVVALSRARSVGEPKHLTKHLT